MTFVFFIFLVALAALPFVLKLNKRRHSNNYDTETIYQNDYGETNQDYNEKKKSNTLVSFIMISSVFWIVGFPYFISGCKSVITKKELTEHGKRTFAVITDVKEYRITDNDGDSVDKHDIYLTYTVNGDKFENVIKDADINVSSGQELEIYYDPENPSEFVSPENVKQSAWFDIVIGFILIAGPFVILIINKIVQLIKNNKPHKRKIS